MTIESVSMETHRVMIDSEQRSLQPCLVVRIAYPPGIPVRVRLDAQFAGSEERFYHEAGKLAALFWPISSDSAPAAIRRIEFVSLNGLKHEAEQRGFHIRMAGLGRPVASDPRPPSVEAGRVRPIPPADDLPGLAPIALPLEGGDP